MTTAGWSVDAETGEQFFADRDSLGHFTAFFVEPVTISTIGTSEQDDTAAADLARTFEASLTESFYKYLAPSPRPGRGVLHVRAAVTEYASSEPVLNAVTMLTIVVPVTSGGASSEIELLDPSNSRSVAAQVAFNNGGLKLPLSDGHIIVLR